MESNFATGRSREAWSGLRLITGWKAKSNNTFDSDTIAADLNKFYARFDTNDSAKLVHDLRDTLITQDTFNIEESDVERQFRRLNSRKSSGPDNISPLVLKICAEQLSGIYCHIFNRCITDKIPSLWKSAIIVPVPKNNNPKVLNDYRPVSLTSVPFKCLERLVLGQLKSGIDHQLDPQQFAYRAGRSTEDAILSLTNSVYEHLDTKDSYARTLFIDFSSAFNTIKPTILIDKLKALNVSPALCSFILDFLLDRIQQVRIGDKLSTVIVINIGSPQGCVLSAFLFTVYTHELRSAFNNCKIIKYADDTIIVGLIKVDNDRSLSDYEKQVSNAVSWCEDHNLFLNVKKTKEMYRFQKEETSTSTTGNRQCEC